MTALHMVHEVLVAGRGELAVAARMLGHVLHVVVIVKQVLTLYLVTGVYILRENDLSLAFL